MTTAARDNAKKPSLADQILVVLGARGEDGGTCQEIERTLREGHRPVSARLTELEGRGLITKTTRTRRIWGGRLARVYAITQLGRGELDGRRGP